MSPAGPWITLRCTVCGAGYLQAAGAKAQTRTCGMLACMVAAGEATPVGPEERAES